MSIKVVVIMRHSQKYLVEYRGMVRVQVDDILIPVVEH